MSSVLPEQNQRKFINDFKAGLRYTPVSLYWNESAYKTEGQDVYAQIESDGGVKFSPATNISKSPSLPEFLSGQVRSFGELQINGSGDIKTPGGDEYLLVRRVFVTDDRPLVKVLDKDGTVPTEAKLFLEENNTPADPADIQKRIDWTVLQREQELNATATSPKAPGVLPA